VTQPERATYSSKEDMLLGQMQLLAGMDPEKFVIAAADEIDMKLGFVYDTPVHAPEGETLPVPVSLLLKRISVNISSGLAILASIGPSTQGERINAYAARLLAEGRGALDAIATGATVLEGAERLPDQGEERRGPRIFNIDSQSQVDAFYSQFTGGTHDMFRPDPYFAFRGVDPHDG
jgi:hypothetical protein